LETIFISKDQLMVIVAKDHRIAEEERVHLPKIAQEPFILSKGGCEQLILDVCHENQIDLTIAFEVRDMSTILSMVKEGIGWTIVPEESLPIDRMHIQAIPIHPPTWRQIGLSIKSKEISSHAVLAFIDVAKELYR